MPGPFENKPVVLGVTGSIACYKAVDLASKLTQQGALVDVVLSESATNFVTPLTFRSITHRPVVTSLWDPESDDAIEHVSMAERADVVVIAPATAHTIAKLVWGFADDVLTTTVLATRAPVIVAPAMDGNMYENPATQENIQKLESRGFTFAGPARGRFASGLVGTGRILETPELLGHIRTVLGRSGELAGRKDRRQRRWHTGGRRPRPLHRQPVVGQDGLRHRRGCPRPRAETVLVTAPTALADPVGVQVRRVRSTGQMQQAVTAECEDADAVIMAAAVADWTPVTVADQKVKKGASDTWSLELTKTPDILAELPTNGLVKVGFAAESEDLERNARAKIESKGLHFIAANDITDPEAGFGSDDNRVVLYDRDGGAENLGLMPKYEIGLAILDRVAALLR